MYFKNFVFQGTDLGKVKKHVQLNQIKFIDQVDTLGLYSSNINVLFYTDGT